MRFDTFKQIVLEEWNKYFHFLAENVAAPWQAELTGKRLLFPDTILFTETGDHFIYEFFGATANFNGLQAKLHKESSTINYLCQSKLIDGDKQKFAIQSSINGGTNGVFLRSQIDNQILNKRFSFTPKLWNESLQSLLFGSNSYYLGFDKDFQCCYLNNCLLGNRFGNLNRIKRILFLAILDKKSDAKAYHYWLNGILQSSLIQRNQILLEQNFQESLKSINPLLGVQYCHSSTEGVYLLAGKFANLFLVPGEPEKTLGEFIQQNSLFIQKALACQIFHFRPELQLVDGNTLPTTEYAIPDLAVERDEGFFDLCALPDLENHTTAKSSRGNLTNSVEKGINQLAKCREYFKFTHNQKFAWAKYEIKVLNPGLWVAIASYNSASNAEIINLAHQLQGTFYEVIDYETLHTMLLCSA